MIYKLTFCRLEGGKSLNIYAITAPAVNVGNVSRLNTKVLYLSLDHEDVAYTPATLQPFLSKHI